MRPHHTETALEAEDALADVRGANILLVEDNDLNQEVAKALLEGAGLYVDMASDGQQAVDMVQANTYDLVLMDVQMPGMDGLTATRIIRDSGQHRDLPIIAMTANAMASDREACLNAGMNDHLAKPINPSRLFGTLTQWIRPRPGLGREATGSVSTRKANAPAVPHLPGIDVADGLSRTMGRQDVYMRLLRKFASNHRQDAEKCRTALSMGDRETALRIAHTAKGVAGQIGSIALQNAAKRLEEGLKVSASQAELAGLLDAFDHSLNHVVRTLETQLPSDPELAATLTGEVDARELSAVCHHLMRRLAESSFETSTEWQSHEPLLRQALGHDFAAIAKAIDNYDYETALQGLRKAALTHNIAL